MVRLDGAEPQWLGEIPSGDPADDRPFLLPGVRVRFVPIGRKAVRAARDAVRIALQLDEADLIGAGDALSEELIKRGIFEWEGVGDREGVPVAPTADVVLEDGEVQRGTIHFFLLDIHRFEAADRVYVRPWSNRDMEGNVSAGSPSGTGAAVTPADDIANSPAAPSATADAAPTRKPAKRAARTSSTSRGRKKAKLSGMS